MSASQPPYKEQPACGGSCATIADDGAFRAFGSGKGAFPMSQVLVCAPGKVVNDPKDVPFMVHNPYPHPVELRSLVLAADQASAAVRNMEATLEGAPAPENRVVPCYWNTQFKPGTDQLRAGEFPALVPPHTTVPLSFGGGNSLQFGEDASAFVDGGAALEFVIPQCTNHGPFWKAIAGAFPPCQNTSPLGTVLTTSTGAALRGFHGEGMTGILDTLNKGPNASWVGTQTTVRAMHAANTATAAQHTPQLSIWGNLVHDVDHAVHDVGHAVHDVGHDVGRAVHDVEHVAHNVANKAERAIAKVGADIDHVEHKIGSAVVHIARDVGKVAQKVGADIYHVEHKIGSAVDKVGHKVLDEARKVANEAEHAIAKVGAGIYHVEHEIGSKVVHIADRVGDDIKHVADRIGDDAKHFAHVVATSAIGKDVERMEHAVAQAVSNTITQVKEHGFAGLLDALEENTCVCGSPLDPMNVGCPHYWSRGTTIAPTTQPYFQFREDHIPADPLPQRQSALLELRPMDGEAMTTPLGLADGPLRSETVASYVARQNTQKDPLHVWPLFAPLAPQQAFNGAHWASIPHSGIHIYEAPHQQPCVRARLPPQ